MLLQIEGHLYFGYLNSGNVHYSGCTSFFMCTQLHSCLTFVLRVISDCGFTHPWMSLKINQLCLVRQPFLFKLLVFGPNKLLFLQYIQRKIQFVFVMFYQKQKKNLHTFWSRIGPFHYMNIWDLATMLVHIWWHLKWKAHKKNHIKALRCIRNKKKKDACSLAHSFISGPCCLPLTPA